MTITATGRQRPYRQNPAGRVKAHSCHLELHKRVSIGYTLAIMKDAGLRIRIQRDLRDQFLEVCRAQDKPAAQVLREFMRDYIDRHAARATPDNASAEEGKPEARRLILD